MRTMKFLFVSMCYVAFLAACTKEAANNAVVSESEVKQCTMSYVYQGKSYTFSYGEVDSTLIYDESDPVVSLYFQLQENPNLAVMIEDESQRVLLFDDSEALVAYIADFDKNKTVEAKNSRKVMTKGYYDIYPQELKIYADLNYTGNSYTYAIAIPSIWDASSSYTISSDLSKVNQYHMLNPNFLSFDNAITAFQTKRHRSYSPYYTHVIFYEHPNFGGGKSIAFTWGTSVQNFKDYVMKRTLFKKTTWNDQISSIKLIRPTPPSSNF